MSEPWAGGKARQKQTLPTGEGRVSVRKRVRRSGSRPPEWLWVSRVVGRCLLHALLWVGLLLCWALAATTFGPAGLVGGFGVSGVIVFLVVHPRRRNWWLQDAWWSLQMVGAYFAAGLAAYYGFGFTGLLVASVLAGGYSACKR